MAGRYVKSQGLPGEHIQRLCGLSQATYSRSLQAYRTRGLGQRKKVRVSSRKSTLQAYRGTLEAYVVAPPPATVAAAQAPIATRTGLQRGPTQVRQCLHALGMQPRHV